MTNPSQPPAAQQISSPAAPAAPVESSAPLPATGSASPQATELTKEQEPSVIGTLFLMAVFLMMIAGFWSMMYDMLIHR